MTEPNTTSAESTGRRSPWKWVLCGLALSTVVTINGGLPGTPMSGNDLGMVIGSCMSGALVGWVLWWFQRRSST